MSQRAALVKLRCLRADIAARYLRRELQPPGEILLKSGQVMYRDLLADGGRVIGEAVSPASPRSSTPAHDPMLAEDVDNQAVLKEAVVQLGPQ